MEPFYLRWFTSDEQFPFFIQYGEHDEDLVQHHHVDFSELVLVLSGHAMHIVNDDASFIKKGDVFVVSGKTSHAYRDPKDFKICNIMYRPELLKMARQDLKASAGFQALFILEPHYRQTQPYKSKLGLPLSELEHVSSIIASMIEEYQEQPVGYQTMLSSKFMELVVYLSRQYEHQTTAAHRNLMHLAKAISYLEDHYLKPLSPEDLAAHASISVRHLNRLFRSCYQTTPLAYLLRLRVERACMLLKNTDLPVSQISYECGFDDSNYFTRQFTRLMGLPPNRFRKQSATTR